MILPYSSNTIETAVKLLINDDVVSFPTETVYGLAASAFSEKGIAKIYEIKGRPRNNPLILHVSTFEEIFKYAKLNEDIIKKRLIKLEKFFPGPLSVILPKVLQISNSITANQETVCIRVPNHFIALELIKQLKLPIVAPSANPYQYISPTKAFHVEEKLGNKIPLIIDGGECTIGIESTIVDLTKKEVVILRPGFVTQEELEVTLEEKISSHSKQINYNIVDNLAQKHSGQDIIHYSPKTKLIFYKDIDKFNPDFAKCGLIILNSKFKSEFIFYKSVELYSKTSEVKDVTTKLFSTLYELDSLNLQYIVIVPFEDKGVGIAINDRIQKATYKPGKI